MEFEKMSLQAFVDELASDSPAPGGGSVAALCGAMASALVSMVANLTVGKEKYRDSWAIMEEALVKSESLRGEFLKLMNEDTESFNSFMAAMKMPRTTDEEKAARKKAMGEASKAATEVPLRTLEACAKTSELAIAAAKHGNPNTVSDAGSAALLADAAGKAAAYNVRINMPGLSDEEFKEECRSRMSCALEKINHNSAKIAEIMDNVLG